VLWYDAAVFYAVVLRTIATVLWTKRCCRTICVVGLCSGVVGLCSRIAGRCSGVVGLSDNCNGVVDEAVL
jgi:hypothetical protein